MASAAAAPPARVITSVAVFLTFASGASDVIAFTRLGSVFTSVMTGNMTMFGLSLARQSVSLGAHTAMAVAGYVTGVTIGTQIGWRAAARGPARPAGKPAGGHWPPHMPLTLGTELLLLAGVLAGWELTGAQPAGGAQYVILAVAAGAMGIQSAAVSEMGLGNVSTTYLTGTLTGLVSALTHPGGNVGWRRPAILGGLVAGALLAGLLVASAAWAAPLLPMLGVAGAILLGVLRAAPSRPGQT